MISSNFYIIDENKMKNGQNGFFYKLPRTINWEDKFEQLLLNIKLSEMTTTFWQYNCSRICEIEFKEDIPLNRYSDNLKNEYTHKLPLLADIINTNNKNNGEGTIVFLLQNLSFDSSSHQSFSVCYNHAVEVASGRSLKEIG